MALYANVAARADVAERWEMMQRLLPPGIAVVKVDPSECASDAEAVEKLAAAEAIVCLPYGGVVVDDALASQLPKLRHVQLLSAGFSEVTPQIAEMQQRGITVSNSACAPCLLATTAVSSQQPPSRAELTRASRCCVVCAAWVCGATQTVGATQSAWRSTL
eukprot:COSAG06_NODE_106_length_23773_cov_20.279083_8_plen_161_part_00